MRRTKKITHFLKAIAKELPAERYASRNSVVLTGEEILQSGQTESKGEPIDPKQKYIQEVPLIIGKNHFRRLKRSYDSAGFPGVKTYLKAYVRPELQNEFFLKLEKALI